MKELSRKTYLEAGKSVPRLFMTARQLSEYEGMTTTHYRHIFAEIEKLVSEGRYPKASITDNKPQSVNYYVYRDYMANRKKLGDKNLKKYVDPFNPVEIASICPMVREVIVMGEDE